MLVTGDGPACAAGTTDGSSSEEDGGVESSTATTLTPPHSCARRRRRRSWTYREPAKRIDIEEAVPRKEPMATATFSIGPADLASGPATMKSTRKSQGLCPDFRTPFRTLIPCQTYMPTWQSEYLEVKNALVPIWHWLSLQEFFHSPFPADLNTISDFMSMS